MTVLAIGLRLKTARVGPRWRRTGLVGVIIGRSQLVWLASSYAARRQTTCGYARSRRRAAVNAQR